MQTLTSFVIELLSLDVAALLLSVILVIILCSRLYLWRHRRYYNMMRKFTGPRPLPIIGNLLTFCGSNTGEREQKRLSDYYLAYLPIHYRANTMLSGQNFIH